MTATLTVIKKSQNTWEAAPTVTRIKLAESSEDALFGHYFRDYANRYKYANSVQLQIEEPDMDSRYRVWIKDVNNYAKNGGDMW